jgi:signal transduction histidine kinase
MYDREMMQVILNILLNARDSFKENDIENKPITITSYKNSLSICDNGGGVPDAIIDKIFDPYFSTKQQKNGTGLGLYMSKIIVEKHHNATLKVKNTNNGVCFSIEFLDKS